MSVIKVQAIKFNEIVDIKVSGGFYSRLHQLLQSMAATVSIEELQKVMKNIAEDKAETALEYHMETLISLISEIETSAKAQGKISIQDLEIPEN